MPVLLSVLLFVLVTGCATAPSHRKYRPVVSKFSDLLVRFPQTDEPLQLEHLTRASVYPSLRKNQPIDVTIMVHPAYSIFLRDLTNEQYPEVKYSLLRKQFDHEAQFILDQANAGKIIILIVPGKYLTASAYAQNYTAYLNSMISPSHSAYYIYSDSPNSGNISSEEMITLYRFLQGLNVRKVLVGGGYVGRCQREFYTQLTTYFDTSQAFIVPEISTISPEDISEKDAKRILNSLDKQDYSQVRDFIDNRVGSKANILSIPPE